MNPAGSLGKEDYFWKKKGRGEEGKKSTSTQYSEKEKHMIVTIILSVILALMALILGAFAWKMRQQEQLVTQYQRNQLQDQDQITELQSRLHASRAQVEELEFQLHLKDSDIRIANGTADTERRNKQEAQQLLEIHRMQGYVSADSAALLKLAEGMRASHTRPPMPQSPQLHVVKDDTNRGNVVDLWAAQALLEDQLGATRVE